MIALVLYIWLITCHEFLQIYIVIRQLTRHASARSERKNIIAIERRYRSIDRWITKLTPPIINRIPSILGHNSSPLPIHFFSLLFFPPSLPPRLIASSLRNLDTTRESMIDPSYAMRHWHWLRPHDRCNNLWLWIINRPHNSKLVKSSDDFSTSMRLFLFTEIFL